MRCSGQLSGSVVMMLAGLAFVPAVTTAAQARASDDMTVALQADTRAISLSGIDQRPVVCHSSAKVLRTAWKPSGVLPHGPQACIGGANRMGAGYMRYLATSKVIKSRPHLRG